MLIVFQFLECVILILTTGPLYMLEGTFVLCCLLVNSYFSLQLKFHSQMKDPSYLNPEQSSFHKPPHRTVLLIFMTAILHSKQWYICRMDGPMKNE